MIVNMPVSGTGGDGAGGGSNNSTTPQGQCDYNFLKRKYEAEQQQHQQRAIHALPLPSYTGQESNPWKKRHVETRDSYAPLLDYEGSRSGHGQEPSLDVSSADMSFQLQLDPSAATVSQSTAIGTAVSSASSSASSCTAAFINDLFAYDASLLVPVGAACSPTAAYCGASTLSTFSAPTISVCATGGGSNAANAVASFDADASWQATDLLELDHRYNSGLQAELGQLNATLPGVSSMQATPSAAQHQQQQQQQQHQQHSSSNSFLVPQKQSSQGNRSMQLPNGNAGLKMRSPSSESEADFEDKNLSWLLNFKFDEFPHLSPDVGANARLAQTPAGLTGSLMDAAAPTAAGTSPPSVYNNKSNSASPASNSNHSHNSSSSTLALDQRTTTTTTKTGRKFEELVMEVTSELDGNDMIVAEHVVVEDTASKAPKKPPFTYTELIEYALEDKGELTVSGIYQWISDRFPYYKSNDDRWKNSVRHNLSINPHFRKGVKAPQGAGHLWAISSGDSAENVLAWEHKKQRLDLFFKMESINRERIQQHQQHIQQQQQLQQQQQQCCSSPQQTCQHQQRAHQHQHLHHQPSPQSHQRPDQCLYDEAAVAAAAITQEMLQHGSNASNDPMTPHSCHNQTHAETTVATTPATHPHPQSHTHHHQRLLPFNDLLSDEELRKTAGQILNGIHREVEVQSVNSIISTYHDVLLDNDYLNPIHKDVVVTESGLRQHHSSSNGSGGGGGGGGVLGTGLTHSQYYITEIDPMELGIQMSHQVEPSEEEVLFSDEFNLNYFGYNPGSDIVA
ncbi:uncharacterized protein LOC115628958 [Scaptodrosophila lebanonensis]|uniref:Uncharacterized protein LOC115628958 n=1 Tax=Drosophila lebanonensis TaxID=7225 RepID=A0A6J2U0U7_DROLE|nr:uncharacterized protein LOC115628958 [Scaptodrosophila lebanonensis]